MDEAVLNIRIKQSRDSRVKKYHQIYRRTKDPESRKAAEENQGYFVGGG